MQDIYYRVKYFSCIILLLFSFFSFLTFFWIFTILRSTHSLPGYGVTVHKHYIHLSNFPSVRYFVCCLQCSKLPVYKIIRIVLRFFITFVTFSLGVVLCTKGVI